MVTGLQECYTVTCITQKVNFTIVSAFHKTFDKRFPKLKFPKFPSNLAISLGSLVSLCSCFTTEM